MAAFEIHLVALFDTKKQVISAQRPTIFYSNKKWISCLSHKDPPPHFKIWCHKCLALLIQKSDIHLFTQITTTFKNILTKKTRQHYVHADPQEDT